MNDFVVIPYSGQQVSVLKEVADFLEQDRKREQTQEKQDERHLSRSEFETVLSGSECARRPVEDAVLWTLRLESLQKAVEVLDHQSRELIDFRYDRGLTMEEIGKFCGVSKMTVSLDGSWRLCRLEPSRPLLAGKAAEKAPRKAEGLCHLTGPFSFFLFFGLQMPSECPSK